MSRLIFLVHPPGNEQNGSITLASVSQLVTSMSMNFCGPNVDSLFHPVAPGAMDVSGATLLSRHCCTKSMPWREQMTPTPLLDSDRYMMRFQIVKEETGLMSCPSQHGNLDLQASGQAVLIASVAQILGTVFDVSSYHLRCHPVRASYAYHV